MLIEHDGTSPSLADDVYVAPTAVVSGDVRIGRGCRVLFGAVITADGGRVELGENCIVMENAVVRGRPDHRTRLGNHVLVGPHSHINGAVIEDDVFIATGVSVFPGARIGTRSEVRISGIVHVNTRIEADTTVPIGWVGVGDPAMLFPPESHEEIWAVQRELDFPGTVYGVDRPEPGSTRMHEITRRYSQMFGRHLKDRVID